MVWFGLDRRFEQTDKLNCFWFALIEFGLVCLIEFGLVRLIEFGLLIPQTRKQIKDYLILITLICEFVFGYSTNKQIK